MKLCQVLIAIAIAKLTDDIYSAINNSELTLAVFIDFKKAFDTLDHNILLLKMKHLGLKDNAIKWFKNYLHGRTQCTVANDITSDPLPITCGVPQGSILGPLLFLCYINDLSSTIKTAKHNLYADDTAVHQSGPGPCFINSEKKNNDILLITRI